MVSVGPHTPNSSITIVLTASYYFGSGYPSISILRAMGPASILLFIIEYH